MGDCPTCGNDPEDCYCGDKPATELRCITHRKGKHSFRCYKTEEPASPHPSDSERTPRTDYDDPALYDFDGMMPQCGYVVHAAHCRLDARHGGMHSPGRLPAIEAESEKGVAGSLDVERLAQAIAVGSWVGPDEENEWATTPRRMAAWIADEYARLSPSTGKVSTTPEQPNQDAGGIPYWPSSDG